MANKCITCGRDIIQNNNSKGGRPKDYCGKDCREIENHYQYVEKLLRKKKMMKHKRVQWKGRLMNIGNEIKEIKEDTFL